MDLLTRAELAGRQAGDHGGGVRCWRDPSLDGSPIASRQERLLQALKERQFFLEFQPQIDLSNGELFGFEALIRWHHPTLGVTGPDAFIPLAEQSGLIFELGQWVLEDACRTCSAWNSRDASETSVAVNVSPIQLLSQGFPRQVERALKDSGLRPDLLELEFTESASIPCSTEATAMFRDLRDLGVRLVLDDFGTGYNSLMYLQHLPVDKIKTPKEFVQDMTPDAPLIDAIAIIGRRLGLEVVAEGVETESQLRAVREAGCHFGQGFLWGQPTTAASLNASLPAN